MRLPPDSRSLSDAPRGPVLHRIALVAAVLLLGSSCGKHGHAPEASEPLPPVEVETHVVASEEVPLFEEVVGTVRPRKEADIAAKVTGRILEMDAIPGMRVKRGEVLARIEVGELEAALERAEAALAQADRDLARFKNLRSTGAIAEAEYEQVESRQRMAVASVEETRTLVESATIAAPFDGTVTRKHLEPGDLAVPGRAIFSMEDPSLLRLEIGVAESLAHTVKLGDEFRVETGGAGEELTGKAGEIAPSADVGSRTFLIKLDLPSREGMRAGQFGRAFLPRGTRRAIRVPEGAVVSRGQMDYVFVVTEGAGHLRIVRAAERRDGAVEILAGLDGGETIVLDPPVEMVDGQPVVES